MNVVGSRDSGLLTNMASMYLLLRVISASILICYTVADTPANCTYEEIKGTWRFYVGDTNFDRTVNCSAGGELSGQAEKKEVKYMIHINGAMTILFSSSYLY